MTVWSIVVGIVCFLSPGSAIRARNFGTDHRPAFCRTTSECFDYKHDRRKLNSDNASKDLSLPSLDEHMLRLDANFAGHVQPSSLSPTMTSCLYGRLVPTFVVLGAQKSATTNFASKLLNVALSVVPPKPDDSDPSFFWKELHVFDNQKRYDNLGVSGWLNYFPNCPETHYAVGMDATPSYLPSPDAPKRMVSWYGTFTNRLNFLVILREPLRRMRSSYYHMTDVAKAMKRSVPVTFNRYLTGAIANYKEGCPSGKLYLDYSKTRECKEPADLSFTGDPLYLSLYVRHLKNWLAEFAPNQFVISGMLTYVAPTAGTPNLIQFMASRLGSSVKVGANTAAIPKGKPDAGTVHEYMYPSFESEIATLTSKERQQLDDLMAAEAGPKALAELLSPAIQRGLTLFGYKGAVDDIAAMSKYIADSW